MIGFIALAAWPLLGVRRPRAFPWIIRPAGVALGSGLMAVFCFWFLAVWSQPELGYVGVMERLAADLESLWPAVVVWSLFFAARRDARRTADSPPTTAGAA